VPEGPELLGVQSSMAPAAYTGPVIYNETDKFKKVEPGDLDKLMRSGISVAPYINAQYDHDQFRGKRSVTVKEGRVVLE
jgi:hypothetical protein